MSLVFNKKPLLQAVPEYQYDYSDIWGDEYPEEAIWEEYPEETLPSSFNSIQRINFAKYGRGSNDKNTSDTKDEVTDALPDNIYCDLVTTLSDKCVQVCIELSSTNNSPISVLQFSVLFVIFVNESERC